MLEGTELNKKILIAIHVANVFISCMLIGVATHCKNSAEITDVPIVGGIIACGVFLLIASIFGIFATFKQHQSFLFYYMGILAIIFIIQFSVSCACLAVNQAKIESISRNAWEQADLDHKHHTQEVFTCCGYDYKDTIFHGNNTEHKDERQWCITHIHCIFPNTTTPAPTIKTTTMPNISSTSTAQPNTTVIKTSASTSINESTTPITEPTSNQNSTISSTTNPSTSPIKTTESINSTTPESTTEPSTTSSTTVGISTSTSDATTTSNDTSTSLKSDQEDCQSLTCQTFIDKKIQRGLNTSGGLGLFFALTQLMTLFLTYRFRNQLSVLGY